MHQTKKGSQWHFGMKAHIGVDERTGLVHTVVSTAANVADVTEVANLLHGRKRRSSAMLATPVPRSGRPARPEVLDRCQAQRGEGD